MLLHVNSKTRRCQVEVGTRKQRNMFTSTTCCFLPALQKIESKNILFSYYITFGGFFVV